MENPKHRIFMAAEVVELHLRKHLPIPPGTAKLIWVLDQIFKGDPPLETKPASIQYYTTPEDEPEPPTFPDGLRLRDPPELGWERTDDAA